MASALLSDANLPLRIVSIADLGLHFRDLPGLDGVLRGQLGGAGTFLLQLRGEPDDRIRIEEDLFDFLRGEVSAVLADGRDDLMGDPAPERFCFG